ncbi:hypothetical protein [Paenarthrobacter ureafaciens]|uniref:hypothetical protein n=1 Tax=Paenarthrobacter ureafaciens TaxID=37931 RepID=UPI001FB50291|nr:hypothetical protein [Paenarthrobacter ureafaciens]UOD83348.1 hypothetical protein MQZ73_20355 [Paenarthrobacter ureafaciens]WNZ04322.1 hypothetical protein PVT25_01825 [Paenarthrobacter ureafaciens]
MTKEELAFHTKRMPEIWRRHFKIYRAKISIYLDTADFGVPMMVDASEMMDLLPPDIEQASFVDISGPVRPGAEAVWIEAEVPHGLASRPNVRRVGAMVHRSQARTSFMAKPFTGADHEFWIEGYVRDADGLSTRLEQDVRFRLDDRGFLAGLEFMAYRSILRPGNNPFLTAKSLTASDHGAQDPPTAPVVEVMNRVFFALALMNCRNVSLRERGSRNSQGRSAEGDAFHEVVIEGITHRSVGDSGSGAVSGAGRRHLARGHFKTFTDDAPLMGKHVGTYWWGWQLRGQEGGGDVQKIYKLRREQP